MARLSGAGATRNLLDQRDEFFGRRTGPGQGPDASAFHESARFIQKHIQRIAASSRGTVLLTANRNRLQYAGDDLAKITQSYAGLTGVQT